MLNARHLGQVSEDVRRAALGCCAELSGRISEPCLRGTAPTAVRRQWHPIEHARHPHPLAVPEPPTHS
jgi:hypothetical protein